VIGAADAQIHCRGDDGEALGAPPLLHALRLGEALPQQIARRVNTREMTKFLLGLDVFTVMSLSLTL
jgi:hypothetical protein